MATKKITFNSKVAVIPPGVHENQVWDSDMNEIKSVVNNNADELVVLENKLVAKQDKSNMKSDWLFDYTGEKYPQHELVRKQVLTSTLAFGCSGLVKRDDSIRLVDLDSTTLRVTANDFPFLFYADVENDYANCLKSFPQLDFPLANIPDITTNGTFIRYVAYRNDGTLAFQNDSFTEDDNYCQLGRILVKRVAGVTTFADTVPSTRNVKTTPDIAGYNNLLRLYAPVASNVECKPNANMTMLHNGGKLTGMSVAFGDANPNLKTVLAQNPVLFSYVSPLTNASSTPPVQTSQVTTNTYYNGTALVPVPNNTNATVQRIMISDNGTIVIQYGEEVFDNFAEAQAGYSTAKFTAILPSASYVEIGRIVAVKNTTNLQNEADCQFYASGGSAGGGGGAAGAGTDIGVVLSATQALITSSTGNDGAIPLATNGVAGLLGGSAQTIYGEKTFNNKILIKQTDGAGAGTIESSTAGILLTKDGTNNVLGAIQSNLLIYKTNSIQATIAAQNLTGSHTYFLPNKDGTFAMTSDIPLSLITGTLTANYIPKATGAGILGDSAISEDDTSVFIGKDITIGNAKIIKTLERELVLQGEGIWNPVKLEIGTGGWGVKIKGTPAVNGNATLHFDDTIHPVAVIGIINGTFELPDNINIGGSGWMPSLKVEAPTLWGANIIEFINGEYNQPLTNVVAKIRNNGGGSFLGRSTFGTDTDNGIDIIQAVGSIKATSSVQVGDNANAASASNVGAIRYVESEGIGTFEGAKQTSAGVYAWIPLGGGGTGVTDLGYVPSNTTGLVTSNTGTDATIPAHGNGVAGLLPSVDSEIHGMKTMNVVDKSYGAALHINTSSSSNEYSPDGIVIFNDGKAVGSAGSVASYYTNLTRSGNTAFYADLRGDGNIGISLLVFNTTQNCFPIVVKNQDTNQALFYVDQLGNTNAIAYFATSDDRLKNRVEHTHQDVKDLQAISFVWKDGKGVNLGYSAQEVQKYIPNAVATDDKGFLSVNYTQVLVAKVQSLEKRIVELENR